MFVAPWSPDFNPEQPAITSAVVTAELRGVPYLLFNIKSLGRITTAIGKPIALAPETERKENFEVAKVMVRVDLTNELPSRIVSGFQNGREIDIHVSYPWLPQKCLECKEYGHDVSTCNRRPLRTFDLRRDSIRSRSRIPRRRRRRRSREERSMVQELVTHNPEGDGVQDKPASEKIESKEDEEKDTSSVTDKAQA